MSEDRECGADAAAYALGALDEREAAAFTRHIAVCAICHDEVATFEQVADELAMTAPQLPPPPGLRKRVMRTVRAEAKATAPRGSRSPRHFGFVLAVPRAGLTAGLAAVMAVAVFAATQLGGGPGARVIGASVIGSPASAQLRVSGGRAELIVRHLPPPPPGRIYEIWLQRAHRLLPTSALFSVTHTGGGEVGVPGDLHGVSAVLVTPEPAGGSQTPTHTPVIIAKLA